MSFVHFFPLTLRKWNYLIHNWLYKYVFRRVQLFKGKTCRALAVTAVFILSGFYHDFVILVALGFFSPLFIIVMALTGAFVLVDPIFKNWNPTFFKMFRNFYGILQLGLVVCILTIEYQTRIACPKDENISNFTDLVSLRLTRCLKIK